MKHSHRFSPLGATALSLFFLAGCAGTPTSSVDERLVREFTSQGYQAEDGARSVSTTFMTWRRGEYEFDLSLALPTHLSAPPLIIYLPGLGESRTSGELWRSAWAEAGYAVLSVQPLAADRDAWQSAAARAGDFQALALARFAAAEQQARLEAVDALMAELGRRHADPDSPLSRVDLSHVALAGYDLGADTVLRLADAQAGFEFQKHLSVQAVIAISPSGRVGEPERVARLRLPVLVITGEEDLDPLGVLDAPRERLKVYEAMEKGNKYLLSLKQGTHQLLSGARQSMENSSGRKEKRPGSAHERNFGAEDTAGAAARPSKSAADKLSAEDARAMGTAAVRGFTQAFLDAHVRNEAGASEWMKRQSKRWLGSVARLQQK